jgi:hypothetical protein
MSYLLLLRCAMYHSLCSGIWCPGRDFQLNSRRRMRPKILDIFDANLVQGWWWCPGRDFQLNSRRRMRPKILDIFDANLVQGGVVVPRAGLEPARTEVQGILSPSCLPFHHLGVVLMHSIRKAYLVQPSSCVCLNK